MIVKVILSRKGSSVVTIEPAATLAAAIATLAQHRIGALVVLGADRRLLRAATRLVRPRIGRQRSACPRPDC